MHGRIERSKLTSRLLEGNPLGDPAEREVWVYLPPGYDQGGHYPTIMMLPGFAGTHRSIFGFDPWKKNPVEAFDTQVAAGTSQPAILVLPDCMTRWGGSQFVDSEAIGPYQSYLADEVFPHVDASFRTLTGRESRAVVGRSSGGFGALRLGMDRPETVSVLASLAGDAAFDVSMRPMLTQAAIAYDRAGGVEAFANAISEHGPRGPQDFDGVFVLCCSAAYAPDLGLPFPHAQLPFDPETGDLEGAAWERWLANDPIELIPERADALASMRWIFVDSGDGDEHGLQFAARSMVAAMRRVGLDPAHEEYEGGHRGTSWRYIDLLPRVVGALKTD